MPVRGHPSRGYPPEGTHPEEHSAGGCPCGRPPPGCPPEPASGRSPRAGLAPAGARAAFGRWGGGIRGKRGKERAGRGGRRRRRGGSAPADGELRCGPADRQGRFRGEEMADCSESNSEVSHIVQFYCGAVTTGFIYCRGYITKIMTANSR